MRVLFSSLGSYGHTLPLVPLARATADAGHDVLFASTEAMEPTLAAAGLTAVAAGIPIRDAFAQLGLADVAPPDRARIPGIESTIARAFGEILPDAYRRDLLAVIDGDRPDLVVAEAGCIGAMQAAEDAGVPCVRHGIGRGLTFGYVAGGLPHLDVYPPSMQDPEVLDLPGYRPLRPVSATAGGPLPRIVDTDPSLPLVYVTLGTEFGSATVLDTIVRAVDTGDRRVLVAAGPTIDEASLRGYSDLVEVATWVPQAAVVARAALVVHHGGAGTTLGTCAAGVPHLVVPQGADQFRNAEAVVTRGLGEQVLPADVTAATISGTVDRLMVPDGAVRSACADVAAEIAAMPSPADVSPDLPGIVAAVG
ncbi:glycosyltransferase [Williamsia serinedens]|uniref:UDP:flavonoid glycosyltransferase YjiC, YdhE family n=1 Tax=Williamsia serinedens TaxID=391736 RepID=A0ABT1H2U0_9NOCA|nr:glycosyltransferase [Williamsia serinedens]MCP2161461.1 UDP:flavonoid glycosyltransferase YjiC, YdhE family [Williamsia serinedens]